jgi:hypothetical protein
MNVSNRSYCVWRRVTGCVAAYALALHGILVAFAGLPIGTSDISDANSLRFELCIHDLIGDAVFPETPSAPASSDTHCKFCIADAHSSVVVPTPAGVGCTVGTISRPPWTVADHDLPVSSRYFSKQPRGPPLTA